MPGELPPAEMPDAVLCTGCEKLHKVIGGVAGVPLIECPLAPDNGSYMMVDTRYLLNYLNGLDHGVRALTGYDGPLWVRHAR